MQKHNNLELVVDSNGDQKYILSTDVVDQKQVRLVHQCGPAIMSSFQAGKSETNGQKTLIGVSEVKYFSI